MRSTLRYSLATHSQGSLRGGDPPPQRGVWGSVPPDPGFAHTKKTRLPQIPIVVPISCSQVFPHKKMPLFPHLQPDLILGSSVLDLTPEILKRYKIEGLVLDVDDTIVPIGNSLAQPELILWIQQIREIVPLWLVTNNPSQVRIGAIADSLSLPYFLSAAKPSRRKLRHAIEAMRLEPSRVAMVGDRVFTDVLAGNRMGMFTILIEPIVSADSSISFNFIRRIEFAIARLLGVSFAITK
jgi:uncharacterized protein